MSTAELRVAKRMWQADKRPCEWEELSAEEQEEWAKMARAAMAGGDVGDVVEDRPPVRRSSAGLREALFDAIDGVRSGRLDPKRAKAISGLAREIVGSVKLEMDLHRFKAEKGGASFEVSRNELGDGRDVQVPALPSATRRNLDADGSAVSEGAQDDP